MAKAEKLHAGWQLALKNLTPGKRIHGDRYVVRSQDDKGFTVVRCDSGKSVRISRKLIETTFDRVKAGEKLEKQANQTQGGISYTVAITQGVVAALAGFVELGEGGLYQRVKGSKIKELIATALLLFVAS